MQLLGNHVYSPLPLLYRQWNQDQRRKINCRRSDGLLVTKPWLKTRFDSRSQAFSTSYFLVLLKGFYLPSSSTMIHPKPSFYWSQPYWGRFSLTINWVSYLKGLTNLSHIYRATSLLYFHFTFLLPYKLHSKAIILFYKWVKLLFKWVIFTEEYILYDFIYMKF